MGEVVYRPIGLVRSPFRHADCAPIQASLASASRGQVKVFPDFASGLDGIEGFSHLVLLWHSHSKKGHDAKSAPNEDGVRGVFATRSSSRPNPICLSVVELVRREGNTLHVRGLDILDGTPVLDIKPHMPGPGERPAAARKPAARQQKKIKGKRQRRFPAR